MYKNATYKEKFVDLQQWIPSIIEIVKKDLKNEHLKKDYSFVKKFFANKNIHKATTEELAEAYQRAINEEERGEEIAEFIASRWLLRNSDLYEFFEGQLSQVAPDFTTLEEIELKQAQALISAANEAFSPPQTYLFAVLNSVVFPEESFKSLKHQAENYRRDKDIEIEQNKEKESVDAMRKGFEREIARLTDKYEKKLSGLQKMYTQETDRLKKQLAQMQRKLDGKNA